MNYKYTYVRKFITQPAFTCSNSTKKTPEQCVKYVQSSKQRHQNNVDDVRLFFIGNFEHTSLSTSKCLLGLFRYNYLTIYRNNYYKLSSIWKDNLLVKIVLEKKSRSCECISLIRHCVA